MILCIFSQQTHYYYLSNNHEISYSFHYFLTCVSHTAHIIDKGWTAVCLSVRHRLVLCQNGSTYHQTLHCLVAP